VRASELNVSFADTVVGVVNVVVAAPAGGAEINAATPTSERPATAIETAPRARLNRRNARADDFDIDDPFLSKSPR
jgi:hypothetical protein